MSKSTDYLDFNWFVGKKIFEKTTGSSLFTDFEEIFEREVKAIEEERKRKEELLEKEWKQKRDEAWRIQE